ncbi:MAG: hypothetical protein JSR27_09985 [Proteobacteria bacterium]|nr:hypothetical protein [Pseudomonadota bacterium]
MSISTESISRRWRLPLGALLLAPLAALACSGRAHIEISNSGVYALDYSTVVAAQPGLADCRADDLVLTHQGTEVPMRVLGATDGKFVAGARIQWLGQMLHGPESWFDPYSTVNVYQLGAAPGKHARLQEMAAPAPGKPSRLQRQVHFEQENLLLRLGSDEMKPGEEPDLWQWAKLTPIDPKPFAFDFDLADLDARAANATLRLDLRGVSTIGVQPDPARRIADHTLQVRLNGRPLQTLVWDGRREIRRDLVVPVALLRAHGNHLELSVPRRPLGHNPDDFVVDVVMVNWIEAMYPIDGNLGASTAAFSTVDAGPIEVRDDAGTPELFGSDGRVRAAAAIGKGRYRFAAADAKTDLYALTGTALAPAAVRAVADTDIRVADPGYADPGYDYLIVAHPSLLAGIEPLAAYHREHGLRVDVVDVDDIYDQFNGGIAHPAAIRDFVAWTRAHWSLQPRFLLLVGDASSAIHHDARNGALNGSSYQLSPLPGRGEVLSGQGFAGMTTSGFADPALRARNLIPTWQYPTAEGQGASDNAYGDPKPGDFHPRVAVGRLPVVDAAELKAIVDKTVAYQQRPARGTWRRDITFISTSEVASFKQESDKLAAELNAQGFASRSIYTDFNDKDREHYEQARARLRQDMDKGSLLVHFLGHGGSYIWRVGPMGDLFSLEDVSALTNAGRYPMVLAMTCFSAPFDNPSDDSIGVRFLREADKGAVAVFAASWKNSPNPQYSKWLIDGLLKPGERIGSAIVAAKARIADRDFVETYNLLGDPALILDRPQGQLRVQVDRSRWRTQVLVRVPAYDFGGNVSVDWFDKDGAIIATQHYQARDVQFALAPVPDAVLASVYVADGRNDFTASGSVSLLAPPVPVKPLSRSSQVTKRRPLPPAADRVFASDFDEAASAQAPVSP